MDKNDRKYVIKVTKNGPDYDTNLWENGALKKGELDFNKTGDGLKKTDHYKLEFTIDNGNLTDAEKLTFAPSNDEVMSVHTDLLNCPPTGAHMDDTFWVDKNKNGKLRLINMDLKQQKLRFNINLVKANDTSARPFIPLDPIVNNGNRGGEETFTAFSYAPIVAGAIVGLGAAIAVNTGLVATNAILFGIGGAVIGAIVSLALGRR